MLVLAVLAFNYWTTLAYCVSNQPHNNIQFWEGCCWLLTVLVCRRVNRARLYRCVSSYPSPTYIRLLLPATIGAFSQKKEKKKRERERERDRVNRIIKCFVPRKPFVSYNNDNIHTFKRSWSPLEFRTKAIVTIKWWTLAISSTVVLNTN